MAAGRVATGKLGDTSCAKTMGSLRGRVRYALDEEMKALAGKQQSDFHLHSVECGCDPTGLEQTTALVVE